MADSKIRVEANSAELPKTLIRSGKFEWVIDEPESFGGQSQGPSPVETLLAAVASCVVAAGHWIAGEMDIVIRSIRVTAEGTIDSDKFFGKAAGKRAGFSHIELTISLDTEAGDDLIKEWLDQTLDRCPVIDNLLKPVHITAQISS